MSSEQYIEIREYAQPTPDGDEITGPLRWYIEGWLPCFDIGAGAGVKMIGDAAIPFVAKRWVWKAKNRGTL